MKEMTPDIAQQSEREFQAAMPISGTVETYFGDYELDHSFPTKQTAEQIYDLMDHQRATQLHLWGLPLVGMTRWRVAYESTYPSFHDNVLVSVKTFNERRGILTANETTDYFFGFSDTRDAATMLVIPDGLVVGMIVDMWQQSPSDIGSDDEVGDLVARIHLYPHGCGAVADDHRWRRPVHRPVPTPRTGVLGDAAPRDQ